MVLGEATEVWLGHKGGAPRDRISALIKELPDPPIYLAYSIAQGHRETAISVPGTGPH